MFTARVPSLSSITTTMKNFSICLIFHPRSPCDYYTFISTPLSHLIVLLGPLLQFRIKRARMCTVNDHQIVLDRSPHLPQPLLLISHKCSTRACSDLHYVSFTRPLLALACVDSVLNFQLRIFTDRHNLGTLNRLYPSHLVVWRSGCSSWHSSLLNV